MLFFNKKTKILCSFYSMTQLDLQNGSVITHANLALLFPQSFIKRLCEGKNCTFLIIVDADDVLSTCFEKDLGGFLALVFTHKDKVEFVGDHHGA